MVRCRDIGAVDMMCYLNSPEHIAKVEAEGPSPQMRERLRVRRPDVPRREGRLSYTAKEYVELQDKMGIAKSLICTAKLWEYTENRPTYSLYYEEEDVYKWVKDAPGRMYGLAGYNPLDIMGSIAKVEKAIKEYGFKGVYVHSLGYNLRVDDRKYYPLYETCVAMDVPVSMQMGHSGEVMPSEIGRPMALDMPALDFPKLVLVGSHTGWPWSEELCAMAMKHKNVYMDCAAWEPRWFNDNLVRWMNGTCRDKTMWGSNAAGTGPVRAEARFDQMDGLLKDEVKSLILRENAMRIYKL